MVEVMREVMVRDLISIISEHQLDLDSARPYIGLPAKNHLADILRI